MHAEVALCFNMICETSKQAAISAPVWFAGLLSLAMISNSIIVFPTHLHVNTDKQFLHS